MPVKLETLHRQTMEILAREIKAIRTMTIGGKLPPGAANDVVKYARLFQEMMEVQESLTASKAKEAEAATKGLSEQALVEALEGKNSD